MVEVSSLEYPLGVLEQARLEIEHNRLAVSPYWEVIKLEDDSKGSGDSFKATLHFWFDRMKLQFTYNLDSLTEISSGEIVDMFTTSLHEFLKEISYSTPPIDRDSD